MWTQLSHALAAGPVVAHGATAPYAAWLTSRLAETGPGPVWAIVPDDDALAQLASDVRFFAPELTVAELPGIEVSPYVEVSPDLDELVGRVATLWRLATGHLPVQVIATSAAALARLTIAPAELAARGRVIARGQSLDRDGLAAALLAEGWQRVPVVDEPGTFAVRGGVVDVFSPLLSHPVRLELFGDDVETLRTFDVESQRTLREIQEVALPPVREVIATGERTPRARLREHADHLVHPSKATRKLIEQLEANPHFVGVHGLVPAFHDHMTSPLAYAAPSATLVLVDPEACWGVAAAAWADAQARHGARRERGDLVYPPEAHLLAPDELARRLRDRPRRLELPRLELVGAAGGAAVLRAELDELTALRNDLARLRAARDHDEEQAAALARAVRGWLRERWKVVIACDTPSRGDRLEAVLAGRELPCHRRARWPARDDHDDEREDAVLLVNGTPSASFASPADRLVVLRAGDVFGAPPREARHAARRAKAALLGNVDDFGELEVGDYLVHQRHGVGRYRGLARLPMAPPGDGAPPTLVDFLNLEYDGATLYLPVYRLGEVTRYVGGEGHAPRLDKLGGVTWEATRKKVARHLQVLAEELLQIYAQRAALPGHAFPPADDSYADMEARFRFEETPDQQAAIDAVLRDMEAPRAMDRLICGDVGYGKTEVALRAVFRCVQGGKQAVVLAPTTVLVEQHARTIAERFADFPVLLGKLSRFQPKAEQLETLRKLADGQLDVVIGTHRLLSTDVRFKDLGLIVIDEEQRFGVAHKERLRRLRTQVDCLTLSATPIPRTLHLAMTGLRDLSIIATPPADRRAVRTFVSRRDDAVIREAIDRELARGGQVFWITRHIEGARAPAPAEAEGGARRRRAHGGPEDLDDRSIEGWRRYLTELVPSARVGVAHGQLSAEELERVMVDFVGGQLDVLIATTIVESGLDIPRANTMFVARADAFGLAQLYQLRGRIGRSKERAYCYLLVPSAEHLTEEALRRLDALQRFTELGAGFQIASRDLEIRGGGELLGSKQSGSIAAVGFDTYVRMLEEAVAELDGRPLHAALDPELSAEVPGFIPDDYVPDPRQRLELYKRLASVEHDDELAGLLEEIQDRYGPIPMDALLLGELMAVKAIARGLQIEAIEVGQQRVAAAMPQELAAAALAAGWRRLADGRLACALPPPGGASATKRLLLTLGARGT
ncbi:MAG: transcription-repair coupling factor [Kofleriaceae bacterium]